MGIVGETDSLRCCDARPLIKGNFEVTSTEVFFALDACPSADLGAPDYHALIVRCLVHEPLSERLDVCV